MDLTASFLAGSLLSWGMPIALLTAVCICWAVVLKRRSGDA